MAPKVKRIVYEKTWPVQRIGKVEEMIRSGGGTRFRVSIADEGRRPFLSKWFNDQGPAADFVDRMAEGFDPREESNEHST